MEGKIFGIPLILILLVIFIAALVDIPMVIMHRSTMEALRSVKVEKVGLTPTLEVTVEPTLTLAPTKGVLRPVSSQSAEVK